jgi:hypothetical protein
MNLVPDSPDSHKLAYDAIRCNDTTQLAEIVSQDRQLTQDAKLLLDAVGFDSAGSVEILVRAGTPLESIAPYWGSTPLSDASGGGKAKSVDALLALGALVDGLPMAPVTGLMAAASNGELKICARLVGAGADVDRDSLNGVNTPLSIAEDPPPNTDGRHALVAEYLRSVGATKPWDYHRPDTFWDGTIGELTLLFVESCLGVTHAKPVGESKTEHATIHIRRARHGWKTIFQTLYSAGLPSQGGHCEVGLCLTSKWPLHRRALEEERFRCPVDFLLAVSDRILQGAPLEHGDLLGREHQLVRGLDWPGAFDQWIAVRHESFETRRREIRDPALPTVLLLVPHLGKKPLKTAKEARTIADAKANVKWAKPAASGAKNNLVVPLCYDAPWLDGQWF